MKQRLAILGSTGSIGVQTLDIVRENSELFEITTLTAHRQGGWRSGGNCADTAVIADKRNTTLRDALADRPVKFTRVPTRWRRSQGDTGGQRAGRIRGAGACGRHRSGQEIALANKESLVVGGEYDAATAERRSYPPIDSEHLAIFQCLAGECRPWRLIITVKAAHCATYRAKSWPK